MIRVVLIGALSMIAAGLLACSIDMSDARSLQNQTAVDFQSRPALKAL